MGHFLFNKNHYEITAVFFAKFEQFIQFKCLFLIRLNHPDHLVTINANRFNVLVILHLKNNFLWNERLCLQPKIFIQLSALLKHPNMMFHGCLSAWHTKMKFSHLQVHLFHQHGVTLNFQASIWKELTVLWHPIYKRLCRWHCNDHHGDLSGSRIAVL